MSIDWTVPSNASPLRVARVFNSVEGKSCGHSLPVDQLTRYLDGTAPVRGSACPLCHCPIVYIHDLAELPKFVFFKYGKQTFRFSFQESSQWYRQDALDSITSALGLKRNGMKVSEYKRTISSAQSQRNTHMIISLPRPRLLKILRRGKILYPSNKMTDEELSGLIIEQSHTDWKSRKATLIVMGTRSGHELRPRQRRSVHFAAIIVPVTMLAVVGAFYLWRQRLH